VRRSRKQDEELRARELVETGKETAGERSLADEAVRLQELIGNTSTTALMARSALQRDATSEAVPADKGEKEKTGASYEMTVSNDIGTFALESVQFGGANPPGTGTNREEEQPKISDLHATKKSDAASTKLMEFAAKGKTIDEVKVVMARDGKPYLTITIKNAYISSFQNSGTGGEPYDSFSLTFTDVKFEFAPAP
jgi:type VI secretion system secreted protein Hcp